MHIGVYGSGYLATVISACLADFGTPVCCCHSDSSRITEVAKGDIPFYEKNLQEVKTITTKPVDVPIEKGEVKRIRDLAREINKLVSSDE